MLYANWPIACELTYLQGQQARRFEHVTPTSVPARHISEGAAPCPYWLAPCPIYKRPARIIEKIIFFFHLQNVTAVVFSDSRCKNADLCLCFHRLPTKSCADLVSFACWSMPEFCVVCALNCVRFCVVCALNCARILVVRTLDCAQFLLHPALFLT